MEKEKIWKRFAPRIAFVLSFAPLMILGSGCGAVDAPIGTAITDLTFEGRSQKTFWIDFTEFHSINGLVPAQDVGTFYYIPKTFWGKELGPSFSIGIVADVRDRSFRLIGETSDTPKQTEVSDAAKAITGVEEKSLAAVQKAITLAGINARLARTNISDAERQSLVTQQATAQTALDTAEAELHSAEATASTSLMKSGMVVAQWAARKDFGGSFSAGSVADVASSVSREQAGYVVAGGLRVVYLFFGNDYGEALASVNNRHRHIMGEVAVTTYLLQAKNIAYVSSLNVAAQTQLLIELEGKKLFGDPKALLNDIDKIRIAGYVSAAARLRNQGVVGDIRWKKTELDFVGNKTVSILDSKESTGDPDWKTINVIYARAPMLNKILAWASSVKPINTVVQSNEQSPESAYWQNTENPEMIKFVGKGSKMPLVEGRSVQWRLGDYYRPKRE